MATRTTKLIVELLDRVSGPAKRAAADLKGLNRATDGMGQKPGYGARIDAAMARNAAAMDRARLGVVDAIGAYYALDAAIGAPIRTAAAFETQLEDIAQKADLPVDRLGALGDRIKEISKATNTAASDIAAAVDSLVGRGADVETALTLATPIARAAVAYRASAEDMANASYAAVDNLKVPADQVGKAIDAMASAGKAGAFELRDMAQYFPSIGAAYQALGQDGVDAVADLAAAMQVVRKGTGDSASAATNLQNVLQKMRSPATVRAFKKMGVDLERELAGAAKRGLTPIEAIAEVTQKSLNGDLSKLGYLFEDAQAQAGIRSLILGMEEFKRIRDDAMKADGTVDADYAARVKTAQGAIDRWRASVERLQISLATALLPALNDTLDTIVPIIDKIGEWTAAHPELASNIVKVIGALTVLRGGFLALKLMGIVGQGGLLSMMASGFGAISGSAGLASGAIGRIGPAAGRAAAAVEIATTKMSRAFKCVSLGPLAGLGLVGGAAVGGTVAGAAAIGYGLTFANPETAPGTTSDPMGTGAEAFAGERAKGGPVSPGRTYLVGERGPEPFTPTRSGYIRPTEALDHAEPSPRRGGATRGNMTVNVTVPTTMTFNGVSAADADTLFRKFTQRLRDELQGAMRGALSDMPSY